MRAGPRHGAGAGTPSGHQPPEGAAEGDAPDAGSGANVMEPIDAQIEARGGENASGPAPASVRMAWR